MTEAYDPHSPILMKLGGVLHAWCRSIFIRCWGLQANTEEAEGAMEWSRPPEKQDALRKVAHKPSDDSPPWIMGATNKVDVPA